MARDILERLGTAYEFFGDLNTQTLLVERLRVLIEDAVKEISHLRREVDRLAEAGELCPLSESAVEQLHAKDDATLDALLDPPSNGPTESVEDLLAGLGGPGVRLTGAPSVSTQVEPPGYTTLPDAKPAGRRNGRRRK